MGEKIFTGESMRKKDARPPGYYWLSLFFVAGVAILTGYFIGLEKGSGEKEPFVTKKDAALRNDFPTVASESPAPKVTRSIEKLIMEKACSEGEDIRPTLNVTYHYAGYLLNAIGGRSYLFRRSIRFRLLVSYYCLLIIHDADRKGKNSYGIDIFPFIPQVREEMSLYPDFGFQEEYLAKLDGLLNYYSQRRKRNPHAD